MRALTVTPGHSNSINLDEVSPPNDIKVVVEFAAA
jgi:hypothetical protein